MSVNLIDSENQWRNYRRKLEKDLFHIRWHQNKSVQQIPRFTRTEGSPSKTNLASRGTLRRPPAPKITVTSSEIRVQENNAEHPLRSAATPYRLPKLTEESNIIIRPKDYVFKEPFSAAHFLLKKDPTRSTPIPECTSPDLRIKPNSTKCRPITRFRTQLIFQTWPENIARFKNVQTDGAKMHRLLPRLSHPGGVVVLADSHGTEPKTPPQSEVEYGVLPMLPVQMVEPTSSSQIRHNLGKSSIMREANFERKLDWQLSPYSNKNFDKQGLGPNQGPFSRELPIKCMPPNNWLRMKIRHRATTKG